MLTVFSDSEIVLLAHILKWGKTVNADTYGNILSKIQDAIRRKCPGVMTRVILFYPDNALSHTAGKTQEIIEGF